MTKVQIFEFGSKSPLDPKFGPRGPNPPKTDCLGPGESVDTHFFLVCLSPTWMSGPNVTKTPSMYADPSNEGYNCNKTWLLLPIYYRTDVLRPSTFRWFGGLLSLLITAHWAEILGLSRLRISVLLVGGP